MFRKYKIEIEIPGQEKQTIIIKKFFTKRGCIKWVTDFTKKDTSGLFYIDIFIYNKFIDSFVVRDEEHKIQW